MHLIVPEYSFNDFLDKNSVDAYIKD